MMAEAEDRKLIEALEAALAAADEVGNTLIAARVSDCLCLLSRRGERR